MDDYNQFYIRVQHDADLRGEVRPDEFVGPFPNTDIAVKHRLLYGPLAGVVVKLDEPPDPDQTMTPGEAVDYVLRRA